MTRYKKLNLQESLGDTPIIDNFEFNNSKANLLPGILNCKELIKKLDSVGKDKFAVRSYKLKNISNADIRDAFSSSVDGWDAWPIQDKDWNEYIVFKKVPKKEESLKEHLGLSKAYVMYLDRLHRFKDDKEALESDLEDIDKFGSKVMEPEEIEDLKNNFKFYINKLDESLHGMNEIEQFVKMGQAIGLKTMADFKDFMDREGQGKDVLTALYDYLHDEIGDLNFDESLKESVDSKWTFIKSKEVEDSDGFLTDYTWYENSDGTQVMVFGDNDIYKPEDGYFDVTFTDRKQAEDWFNSY